MFYSNIEGLQPKVLFPVSVLNQAFHVTPRVAEFVASLLGGEERAKCFRRDVGNRKIICIQSKLRECSASVYLSVNKSGWGGWREEEVQAGGGPRAAPLWAADMSCAL